MDFFYGFGYRLDRFDLGLFEVLLRYLFGLFSVVVGLFTAVVVVAVVVTVIMSGHKWV